MWKYQTPPKRNASHLTLTGIFCELAIGGGAFGDFDMQNLFA